MASEEAFQINGSIENLWGQSYSRDKIGYAYWERGRADQAVAVMADSICLREVADFAVP